MQASHDLSTYVCCYDNVLDNNLCDSIIERFEADHLNHFKGLVTKADGSQDVASHKQTTELVISNIPYWQDIVQLLLKETYRVVQLYAEQHPWFGQILKSNQFKAETIRLKRYVDGQHFDWHVDANCAATNRRILAIQYYFNTNDTGYTVFPFKEVKPVVGRVVVFPCNFLFPHKGSVVTGKKYICTMFLVY